MENSNELVNVNRDKEFMREHAKSIIVTLRNSKLSVDRLQQRLRLMRKSFLNQYDKNKLDDIEKKIIDIMSTTGKEKFSEEDIDIILRQTLGLEIRDYDKSHLVNLEDEEITSIEPHGLPLNEIKPYTYGDTTITKVGTLIYKDWRGVDDLAGLSCYFIERKDKNGKVIAYPNAVFSRINFKLMDVDPDYREAVLYSLLEEKNMRKTNCGGYIGNIQTVEEGKSLEDTVKVNSKYSLVFDSTDATAVVKLRSMIKERKEQPKKDDEGR